MASTLWVPAAHGAKHAPRPNILWITSEDNAAQWLGCYGNREAQTPRLDALAREGLLYTHAYSNAPVCAVARCTLLHGVYSVTLGTQHMRSRYPIPPQFKAYVDYLRALGYYCTNNVKTDFNFKGNDRAIWDQCSRKAHYKHRPPGSPFFAIFNLTVSHESSLFPKKVASNRRRGEIPQQTRLDAATLTVPPYLPDLPAVRSDLATYHDTMTALDRQVGNLLDELAAAGLADDTIVFYYADHGGPTPRGKRYLTDTGVRVPLLIRVPEKWRALSPFQPGQRVDELVSFVDFAPTLLSLGGEKKPKQMQGRPFLGSHRVAPAKDAMVFLYADRFDEIVGMRRGITDGRYKYIRCFSPHLPAAPYSYYSLSMPSWVAWREAWRAGKLSGRFNQIWQAPQPVERLFDTSADPWEINNLADAPEHAELLARLRARLRETMAETRDTGLVPESMFATLAGRKTIYDFVRSPPFNLEKTLELAFLASQRKAKNLPALTAALTDPDPLSRYWGARGCLFLGASAHSAILQLTGLLTDRQPTIRITAARALFAVGKPGEGKQALLAELAHSLNSAETLLLINAITQIDATSEVPRAWLEQ